MEIWRRTDTERAGEEEAGITCKNCTLKKEQHAKNAWSSDGGQTPSCGNTYYRATQSTGTASNNWVK